MAVGSTHKRYRAIVWSFRCIYMEYRACLSLYVRVCLLFSLIHRSFWAFKTQALLYSTQKNSQTHSWIVLLPLLLLIFSYSCDQYIDVIKECHKRMIRGSNQKRKRNEIIFDSKYCPNGAYVQQCFGESRKKKKEREWMSSVNKSR